MIKHMSKKFVLVISIILVSIFIIFSSPVDILFAKIPYHTVTRKFYGEVHAWCTIIYYAVPVITALIILVCSVTIIFANTVNFKARVGNARSFALITLLSLGIGPGIIVNAVLKNNWGRARPYQVLRDNKQFSPVWKPNFGVYTDNSFPSGHAAIGFFLGVPFFVRKKWLVGVVVGSIGGVVIGLVRILQGGHYFSDVVLSGVIVWLSALLVLYVASKLIYK